MSYQVMIDIGSFVRNSAEFYLESLVKKGIALSELIDILINNFCINKIVTFFRPPILDFIFGSNHYHDQNYSEKHQKHLWNITPPDSTSDHWFLVR